MLDYLARWIQENQIQVGQSRGQVSENSGIARVNSVLQMIPPEVISQRAVECKSYARALFYWEQHIRRVRETNKDSNVDTALLQHLQDIYTQIDEPDGIEGISAKLHILDIDQQILGHRKAGRWTAAQSWYEIKLAENPDDVDVQLNLLTCLKESGQHGQYSHSRLFTLLKVLYLRCTSQLCGRHEDGCAKSVQIATLCNRSVLGNWEVGCAGKIQCPCPQGRQ